MAAAQGREVHRPLQSSPLMEPLFAEIRSRVAFLDKDRLLAPDIDAMRLWASRSDWPEAVSQLLPSHPKGEV